jgi:hypothetical protein
VGCGWQDDVSDEVGGRDVLNERPTADEAAVSHDAENVLGKQVSGNARLLPPMRLAGLIVVVLSWGGCEG